MRRPLAVLAVLASVSSLACSTPAPSPTVPDAATDVTTTDLSTPDVTSDDVTSDDVTSDATQPSDVPVDRPVPTDTAPTRCGTARPSLTGTSGTEGVVIGPDGAIYFSQAGSVGRIAVDGTRNNRWAAISGATTMWGLALDVARNRLYAGSPVTRKIHAVDLSADPPTVSVFVSNAGSPNGLTMGPDGNLYYSDFGVGQVYRVDGDGMRTVVTASGIAQANGLAFDAAGDLLVLSYAEGQLFRLTMRDGRETERTVVAEGLGSADGLALDAMGNFYVTDQSRGRLIRLSPTGGSPETLLTGLRSPANIEFGAGALPCTDVYVATGAGLQLYQSMIAGAEVPWHH